MQTTLKTTLACALFASVSATNTFAEEILLDAIPQSLEAVPLDIRQRAAAFAPGVALTSAEVEIENGETIYELAGIDANGRRIEIDIFDDGTLDEIETEEGVENLPDAVRTALDRAAPGATIAFIEKSVHGDGRRLYEIEVVTASGAALAYEITEGGEIASIEDSAMS